MSKFFRFDLKLALLLVVDLSILCWVGAEAFHHRPQRGWPQDEMEEFYKSGPKQEISNLQGVTMTFALITPLAFTLVWLARTMNRPILTGAVGGIVGLFALLSVDSTVLGVHYLFFYQGGGEYLEDGALRSLVVYPVVGAIFCSPLFAAMGATVGGVFWARQVVMRRRARISHEQSQRD